eukprot:COSAG06_NODE_601_length_13893_cov_8.766928_4_plen_63_part_00
MDGAGTGSVLSVFSRMDLDLTVDLDLNSRCFSPTAQSAQETCRDTGHKALCPVSLARSTRAY